MMGTVGEKRRIHPEPQLLGLQRLSSLPTPFLGNPLGRAHGLGGDSRGSQASRDAQGWRACGKIPVKALQEPQGPQDNEPIEGGVCRGGRRGRLRAGCSPGSVPRLIEEHQEGSAPFQHEGGWSEKSICCGEKGPFCALGCCPLWRFFEA